jgi:hypothetical protein
VRFFNVRISLGRTAPQNGQIGISATSFVRVDKYALKIENSHPIAGV